MEMPVGEQKMAVNDVGGPETRAPNGVCPDSIYCGSPRAADQDRASRQVLGKAPWERGSGVILIGNGRAPWEKDSRRSGHSFSFEVVCTADSVIEDTGSRDFSHKGVRAACVTGIRSGAARVWFVGLRKDSGVRSIIPLRCNPRQRHRPHPR